MSEVISQLAILFSFMAFGFVIGKIKRITVEKSNLLSVLLVNAFLPCKVFLNFSTRCTLPYLKSNFLTLFMSTAILLFLVLFSWLISKRLSRDKYEQRVYRYSFAISNYAYLGYVLVEAVLGAQALTDMILFCIPFAFYTYTFGYALLTAKNSSVKRIINPMTAALALGMLFGVLEIPLPSTLSAIFGSAAACVGPISMILTGIVIASFAVKEILPDVKTVIFVATRLVVIPAMLFLICVPFKHFGLLPDAIYPAAVIMGCMPCGLNTVVFPMLVGEDCRMGARFVLLSHAVCLITIPLWIWILI